MRILVALLLFAILFTISWPLAILLIVFFPIIWLILLPFRIVGFTISALFDVVTAILLFPFRLLKKIYFVNYYHQQGYPILSELFKAPL